MKKIDMIRAIVILQEMGIMPNKVFCFEIIREIIKNTKYKKLGKN